MSFLNTAYDLVRPLLFTLDPETAHNIALSSLSKLSNSKVLRPWLFDLDLHSHKDLTKEVFGLKFNNPVGMAAGFDKDGHYLRIYGPLGFGFVELGTVTPVGQPGNPKPRLFRLKKDNALINRMGFNNLGVDQLINRLKAFNNPYKLIIGGNLGKNKSTPNEKAVEDYEICFQKLFPFVDYFVINVSSPNTPGLLELQEKEALATIVRRIQFLNRLHENPKPVLVKVSPDIGLSCLDSVLSTILDNELAGIVATNTTISRKGLSVSDDDIKSLGTGGLSGLPLFERSTKIVQYIRKNVGEKLGIIGVGGIHSPDQAMRKLDAGADLVQIYTGFIYKGPRLVARILDRLR
jgi:dihydroorotate dehydrogenase